MRSNVECYVRSLVSESRKNNGKVDIDYFMQQLEVLGDKDQVKGEIVIINILVDKTKHLGYIKFMKNFMEEIRERTKRDRGKFIHGQWNHYGRQ